MRLDETKKSSWITSLRSRRDSRQLKTISLSRKNTHQPPKKGQAKSLLTLMNYPHFLRRMTLWRGEALAIFSGAARTPSPPQDPDLAEIDTDNHSLSTNNDVERTGEPVDARRKRRRGPDGAAVGDESVDVGRSNHGVGEADAWGESVGVGRPSTG